MIARQQTSTKIVLNNSNRKTDPIRLPVLQKVWPAALPPTDIKVRILTTGVMENLLYKDALLGHSARTTTPNCGESFTITPINAPIISKAPTKTQCESIEMPPRKWRLLFARAIIARQYNRRLPRRVTFEALYGGKPGDRKVQIGYKTYQARPPGVPSLQRISVKLWSRDSAMLPTAAKKWGMWRKGVVKGAEKIMVEWHRQGEAKRCALRAK